MKKKRGRPGLHFFLSVIAILVIVIVYFSPRSNLIPSLVSEKKVIQKTGLFSKPPQEITLPIITYHYVEYVSDPNDFIRESLAITPYTFEQHLGYIRDNNYETIFVNEIPAIVEGEVTSDKKPIALTFDDGYEDFYTDVFPLLKKHNAKATIYLVWVFINQPNYMKTWQIKEVLGSGLVELGSHGVGHMNLPQIDPGYARREIRESRQLLSSLFGVPVTTFCYPYGGYNQELQEYARRVGYVAAVSLDEGKTQSVDNLFSLARFSGGGFFYTLP